MRVSSFAFVVAGAVLASVLVAGCQSEPASQDVLRPVRTTVASPTVDGGSRTYTGTVQAGRTSQRGFRVGGTVAAVPVNVGDRVTTGDVLARLETEDLALRADDARAAVDRAEAEFQNAAAEYRRVRALYENGNASASSLDRARTAFESARAALSSARKRLRLAERRLDYATLEADAPGRIADVRVEAGETVSAGQTVVLQTSGTRLEVTLTVPEVQINQIVVGDTARVSLAALGDTTLTARVTEVGVSSIGARTTYPVTVRLLDSADRLRPGMAAEVSLQAPTRAARPVVPLPAVGEDRRGRFVYVVRPDTGGTGIVRRRPVQTGDLTARGIEVLSGLQRGDRVVTAGMTQVADSQRVRLPADPDRFAFDPSSGM